MKISIVAGARPNFIKIAPLVHAIERFRQGGSDLSSRLIYTGSAHDASLGEQLFEDLRISRPDTCLGFTCTNQNERAAAIMTAFERELAEHPTDIVLVVDDLTPTMACAIVAKKMEVKVAHLIAGTRSFDMTKPKEVNSMIADGLSDYLFTAGYGANSNLNRSGASLSNTFMVGNILMDAIRENWDRMLQPDIFRDTRLDETGYILFTANRPMLVGNKTLLNEIVSAICNAIRPMRLVAPLHDFAHNAISSHTLHTCPNLVVTTPMRCLEFWYLEKNAKGIITDSGNVAEEATFIGTPCITMNNYVEHKETVTIGSNELAGENPALIAELAGRIVNGKWKACGIPERWDGRTATRIIQTLINM